jgi:hypothetical protein
VAAFCAFVKRRAFSIWVAAWAATLRTTASVASQNALSGAGQRQQTAERPVAAHEGHDRERGELGLVEAARLVRVARRPARQDDAASFAELVRDRVGQAQLWRHARRDGGRRPVLRRRDEAAEALAPEVDRGLVGGRELDRQPADALEQPGQGEAVVPCSATRSSIDVSRGAAARCDG